MQAVSSFAGGLGLAFEHAGEMIGASGSFAEGELTFVTEECETVSGESSVRLARDEDAGSGVCRNANGPCEFITSAFPRAYDFAVKGAVSGAGVVEAVADKRTQDEPLKTGNVGVELDASDVAE